MTKLHKEIDYPCNKLSIHIVALFNPLKYNECVQLSLLMNCFYFIMSMILNFFFIHVLKTMQTVIYNIQTNNLTYYLGDNS